MSAIPVTRETSVEIDPELLSKVRRILETVTLRETIEQAFREVLRSQARREEVAALTSMSESDLADETVMAGAWRS